MPTGRLRVLSVVPGSTSIGPILSDFCRKGEGVVTSFSDALLPALRDFAEEQEDLEVVPFGALVSRVAELCGEDVRRISPAGHQLAAVAHACKTLTSESPFERTSMRPGAHEAILRTLKELHAWGIDADVQRELAASASPRLAAKLQSLEEIDRSMRDVLSGLGLQSHTEQIQACLEGTPEWEAQVQRYLVFVGAEVHPLRLEWLNWAVAHGAEVTVVLDRHASDGGIFRAAKQCRDALAAPLIEIGDGNYLLRNLFGSGGKDGAKIDVTLSSAADSLAEAEWALRSCLSQGELDSCGIYVRDLESYGPLLEAAARRLKVALRIARRAPLLTNAFARVSLELLRFCASNDFRDLLPVVKMSYFRLGAEERNSINGAIRDSHGMRALQWDSFATWASQEQERFPWLLQILEWRKEARGAPVTLATWHKRLDGLLVILRERLLEPTEGYQVQRDTRANSVMLSTLANEASIDHAIQTAREVNVDQFVALCDLLWGAADVSVPGSDEGVLVASDGACLVNCDLVCVLGMLEGVFPRRRAEDPILTDSERLELNRLRPGKAPMETSRDVAEAERDEFYRVCAAAKRKLLLSYPLADDQRDNVPAFWLQLVRDAAGSVETLDHPRPELAPDLEDCLADADRELREALGADREAPPLVEITREDIRTAIRGDLEAAHAPQEFRDALQCPFQYVARHRLRLKVGRRSARWASLRQLPMASGLIHKKTEADAEMALIKALDAELERIYSDVPAWELQLLRAGGKRLIKEWLEREFRARKLWPKDEGSVRPNVPFGHGELRDMMPGKQRLVGTVPAVSKMGDVTVTHLYGSAVEDVKQMSDPEKLFLGLHFLAMYRQGQESAIEVESAKGDRNLVVLNRFATLASDNGLNIRVSNLGESDDPSVSRETFYQEIRTLLKTAVLRMSSGNMEPRSGEHCGWCDYGELCRRSKEFGEDDSPFMIDSVFTHE